MLALLLKLPCEPGVWQRASGSLGEGVAAYWHQVQFSPWGLEENDLREAAEKLVLHGQPAAAVDCLYVLAEKKASLPMELASAALMGLLTGEGGRQRFESHHIIEVVKALQQQESVDSAELVRIEWNLLPLLNRISGGEPRALEYRLASSAEFFGEIIGLVFRSDSEDHATKKEPNEQERLIAQNAYRLLHGWRILPGTGKDGSFNGEEFTRWVDEVKARTKSSGHYRIAMSQLGQVLAYAPPDADGLWIHRSVASALDGKDVPDMRSGFVTGLFNERGVHGFTHGAEENKIAGDYDEKAKALSDSGFHRVADALRSLADDYRHDAQRESRRDVFDEG